MRKNVLLINPTIRPIGVELLEKECNIFMAPDGKEDTLIRYIVDNNIDAIVTRVEKITKNIIKNCNKLKIIAQHGVGVDNIDVIAATEKGIMVLNVPDANYVSVAEHALMLVLALSRRLLMADKNVRMGNWEFRETNIPIEIAKKNLFIIGLGRIGKEFAQKAKAMDMNVKGYDLYVSKAEMASIGVEKIDELMDGIKDADFISIHTPLTLETKGLISSEQFSAMKNDAYIINLGRGSIIDEKALYDALKNKEIAGAGLDVFELEPADKSNPLFEFDNVIVTPHFGGDTIEGKDRCSLKCAQALIEALNGKIPYNCVN
ncbi:MAG: hydroxyacid dehydrogenase [Candidatus Atribacteria bacterium]|jgi:D-3-phosphoglycerate dehydrogenase|nr:hydroxyacid dehydrogenase [Candidatus Atribacteria bacterium]